MWRIRRSCTTRDLDVYVKQCFWGGKTILIGFSKQQQSLHYALLSLATRRRFIPVPLSEKPGLRMSDRPIRVLPLQLFLLRLVLANTRTHCQELRLALAPGRDNHRAITRELGNREEIQSLKGLNTGRGSGVVGSRGARCTLCWMGPRGGCNIPTIWQKAR